MITTTSTSTITSMLTTTTTTTSTITAARRRSKKELEREARARAREMVARSQIRQYPEPVLREPARPVSEFSDDLRALVERMITLMDDANGVGLAGNQVGLLRRVLVYRPDREDAEAQGARQSGHRRALGGDWRSTRRAASRSARCACPWSATCASRWTPRTRTASRCTSTPRTSRRASSSTRSTTSTAC